MQCKVPTIARSIVTRPSPARRGVRVGGLGESAADFILLAIERYKSTYSIGNQSSLILIVLPQLEELIT